MPVSAVFIAVTLFQMPDLVQAIVTKNDSTRSLMGGGGRNLAKLCVKMDCPNTSTEVAHRPKDMRGSNRDASASDGKQEM